MNRRLIILAGAVLAAVVLGLVLLRPEEPADETKPPDERPPAAPAAQPTPEVATPPDPRESVTRFFQALAAGRLEEARGLTATFAGLSPERIDAWLQRLQKYMEIGGGARVITQQRSARAAVVILQDLAPGKTGIDLDPAYLVFQQEQWKILFRLTRYKFPFFGFDEPMLEEFRGLEKWYQEQKPRLIDRIRTDRIRTGGP